MARNGGTGTALHTSEAAVVGSNIDPWVAAANNHAQPRMPAVCGATTKFRTVC